MGRKKIHITPEQQAEKKREWAMKWYNANKEKAAKYARTYRLRKKILAELAAAEEQANNKSK